mmetsp:Transcript_76662/g.169409  ORF Transcript_76662/g.169409 Transcript_76662/m.169409 type:complete len:208 (-) Transcript_76662:2544-3167(-)
MFWRIHMLQKLVVGHLTLRFEVPRSLRTLWIKQIISISLRGIAIATIATIAIGASHDVHTLHGHTLHSLHALHGLARGAVRGGLSLGRHGHHGLLEAFQDLVGRTLEVGRQRHITDDAEQGVPVLKVSYSIIASDSQPPLRIIRKTSCFDAGHLHLLLLHRALKNFDHLIRLKLPHCVVARHLRLLRHDRVLHNLAVGPHHLTEDIL